MSQWTEELKQQVIAEYEAQNPTPETTTEILQELAEKHEKTVNGVRMILSKAEVYVAKSAATATTSASGDKTPRKSKQESLDELTALLEGHSVTADAAIIDKLTGKAAEYFIGAFKQIIES